TMESFGLGPSGPVGMSGGFGMAMSLSRTAVSIGSLDLDEQDTDVQTLAVAPHAFDTHPRLRPAAGIPRLEQPSPLVSEPAKAATRPRRRAAKLLLWIALALLLCAALAWLVTHAR